MNIGNSCNFALEFMKICASQEGGVLKSVPYIAAKKFIIQRLLHQIQNIPCGSPINEPVADCRVGLGTILMVPDVLETLMFCSVLPNPSIISFQLAAKIFTDMICDQTKALTYGEQISYIMAFSRITNCLKDGSSCIN